MNKNGNIICLTAYRQNNQLPGTDYECIVGKDAWQRRL